MLNIDEAPLCACGCGLPVTPKHKQSDTKLGVKRGEWRKCRRGHGTNRIWRDRLNKSKLQRIYYKQDPDRYRKYQKTFTQKAKLDVLTHYANGVPKCNCRSEAQIAFLTIDHIVPIRRKRDKDGNRNGVLHYAKLRMQGYPTGFQVLCFNCNCAKAANPVCPHQQMLTAIST